MDLRCALVLATTFVVAVVGVPVGTPSYEPNAAIYQKGNPYFVTNRQPVTESIAVNMAYDRLCTAIYTINLRPEYTTQGNDIAMLQPHGKDTSIYRNSTNFANNSFYVSSSQIGADYTLFPNPSDIQLQTAALNDFSVPALYGNAQNATPIGFKMDNMRMYYSVCVQIRGVQNRWVEIMAQTPQPDRKICYEDWRPDRNGTRPNLAQNPFEKSCSSGELYVCRSSPNEPLGGGKYVDEMNIRFFCESCDDEVSTFYWRVTASQMPVNKPTDPQPDAEDWCLYRSGHDYPKTLLSPYPENYVPPAVFQQLTSASMSAMTSLWLLGLLAVALLFL